jgi:hypothetical protein
MPNVSEKLTFGIELEGLTATPGAEAIAQRHGFIKRYDHSIMADDGSGLPRTLESGGGFEFITPVIVVNVRMSNVGENLIVDSGGASAMVEDLCGCIAHFNKSCGVHVHLGRPTRDNVVVSKWEPERVRTMLTIGMLLEEKIFSVMPDSRRGNHHSASIRTRYSDDDLGQFYPTGNVVTRKFDNIKRYCWMNLIETKRVGTDERPGRGSSHALGTIEVRSLGNTVKFEYIWAWTNLLLKIAAYVAYLPSSLAILRCGMINSFEDDFSLLGKYKAEIVETLIPTLEPSRIVPSSTAANISAGETRDGGTAYPQTDQRLTGTPHPRRMRRTRPQHPITPLDASLDGDDSPIRPERHLSSNANVIAEREARRQEDARIIDVVSRARAGQHQERRPEPTSGENL